MSEYSEDENNDPRTPLPSRVLFADDPVLRFESWAQTRTEIGTDLDTHSRDTIVLPPAEFRDGWFTYGPRGFLSAGLPQAPVRELRSLFDEIASRAQFDRVTADWLRSQLLFSGVIFDQTSIDYQYLFTMLRKAFEDGKCDTMAPSVRVKLYRLEKEAGEASGMLDRQVDGWLGEIEHFLDLSFSRSRDPVEELKADKDRFLEKYFPNGGVKLAPGKAFSNLPVVLNLNGRAEAADKLWEELTPPSTPAPEDVGWEKQVEKQYVPIYDYSPVEAVSGTGRAF